MSKLFAYIEKNKNRVIYVLKKIAEKLIRLFYKNKARVNYVLIKIIEKIISLFFKNKARVNYLLKKIVIKIIDFSAKTFQINYFFDRYKLKIISLNTWGVGHLLADADTYIKEKRLGLVDDKISILLMDDQTTANLHSKNYLSKYFHIISNKYLIKIIRKLVNNKYFYEIEHYTSAVDNTAYVYYINTLWNDKKFNPNFNIDKKEKELGRLTLKALGVNEEQWFVCLHVRESSYSPELEQWHSYRNTEIETYQKAVNFIESMGGKCIRMGDNKMSKLNFSNSVIDYAHSEYKSEWMDFYLSSQCLFFIGTGSGASSFPFIFGKPIVSVNIAPLSCCPHYNNKDISIPKLYYSKKEGRVLKFKEIFDNRLANLRFTQQFKEAEIILRNNDELDIKEAVEEMYLKITDNWLANNDDKINQIKYKSLFKFGDYAYGAQAEIGTLFLRRHIELL
jgi:putative glycosyltransferase (TIGR04372 family)